MTNLGFLVAHVTEKLKRLAEGQKGPHLQVEDWPGGGFRGDEL